uniref:Uncharacterized protein n=1 Tax=Anguilla anguilla TaxID=7936 RepID=A0A0E9WPR4_ANGAN
MVMVVTSGEESFLRCAIQSVINLGGINKQRHRDHGTCATCFATSLPNVPVFTTKAKATEQANVY